MNPEHITWLYIPMAILLGALHGLEPGHSKTMMAAFIIAIRGTFTQAIILGVSAALSHSLIIWVLAGGALYFGQQWDAATFEPYMQLFSAAAILTMAFWMFGRTSRDHHDAHHHHHHHGHAHGHSHHHHGHHHHDHEEGVFLLHIGHQHVNLSVFEDGVPPVFRLKAPKGERLPKAHEVSLETTRPDGTKQRFTFVAKEGFLESIEEIPEPHEFEVSLSVAHGDHSHAAHCSFKEGEHHDHGHSHDHDHGHHHHHGGEAEDFQDAHEREHAEDIQRRFAGRTITTPQIALFGITGGLMPCPAAFSVLLICLQLKKFTLGFAMVAAFSFGLALTMVTTGLLAAWSVHHAEKKFKGFGEIMRKAPYVSCVLLVVVAAYMAWHGWQGLMHAHAH